MLRSAKDSVCAGEDFNNARGLSSKLLCRSVDGTRRKVVKWSTHNVNFDVNVLFDVKQCLSQLINFCLVCC